MIRKVSFSLKLKIIGLLTIILSATVAFYINFAVTIFREDKSAIIFSNAVEHASTLSSQVQVYLNKLSDDLGFLGRFLNFDGGIEVTKEILEKRTDIIEYAIFEISNDYKRVLQVLNKDVIESYEKDIQYFQNINSKDEVSALAAKISEKMLVLKAKNGLEIPHFWILKKDADKVIFARMSFEVLEKIILKENVAENGDLVYENFLVDIKGKDFFSKVNLDFNHLLDEKLNEGTLKRKNKDGDSDLLGISRLDFDLTVVSKINKKRAFRASNHLIEQSLFYGSFVLSLSIIISIFFSRKLTGELAKLFSATQKVAERDFSYDLKLKGRDEIGALSDSFNFMRDEILNYMGEMAEKIRLENEVHVAKLVQESFFPRDHFTLRGCSVKTFYAPASECGGDWFDAFELGDKVVFIMADATGHGVPAALVTAAANCCAQNMRYFDVSRELLTPSWVLMLMNNVLFGSGHDILMTAFVAVYDVKKKVLSYSNASHNPPLILKHKEDGQYVKQDLIPLMVKIGPRLGHVENSDYEVAEVIVDHLDRVVFFTDGIIEGKNKEKKDYGQRRFLRSMISYGSEKHISFCDSIISDAYKYYNDEPQDDDISLMTVEFELKKEMVSCQNRENVLNVLSKEVPDHYYGENALFCDKEHTIIKRAMISKKTWGLENYLENGIFSPVVIVNDSNKVESFIKEGIANLPFENVFEKARDQLALISHELLTNALYHSGIEGVNFEKRSSQDRRIPILLEDNEGAIFRVGEDEEYIAVSVCDQSGILAKEKIISSLERSFKEMRPESKDGGAGLGLYISYQNSNIIIINRENKKRTEIIAIIEKTKRFKKYKERVTSFHYFEES